MAQILIFGDSITWGAWDEEGGWVHRIKKDIDKKVIESNFNYYNTVYNLGISGDETDNILKRFEPEIVRRLDENEEAVIIFAIGVNDSQYINAERQHRVPLERFKQNLEKLTQLARKHSNKIIFIGLTPVDDSLLDPTQWDIDNVYKNEYVEKFNIALEEFCIKEGLPFIKVFEPFMTKDYKNLLIDGLHPNSKGHKLLFELVKNHLVSKRLI